MQKPRYCPINQVNPDCKAPACDSWMPDEKGEMRCIWADDPDVADKYRTRPEVTREHMTGKIIIK